METSVTIIGNNISKSICNKYSDYKIINTIFVKEDLKKYNKVLFYNVLNYLKETEIKELYDFLDNNNIKFVNVTNNIEHILFTKYLCIYNNNDLIKEGYTMDIVNSEKLFKELGLARPFICELSTYLKDYGLISENYYSKESLKEALWK